MDSKDDPTKKKDEDESNEDEAVEETYQRKRGRQPNESEHLLAISSSSLPRTKKKKRPPSAHPAKGMSSQLLVHMSMNDLLRRKKPCGAGCSSDETSSDETTLSSLPSTPEAELTTRPGPQAEPSTSSLIPQPYSLLPKISSHSASQIALSTLPVITIEAEGIGFIVPETGAFVGAALPETRSVSVEENTEIFKRPLPRPRTLMREDSAESADGRDELLPPYRPFQPSDSVEESDTSSVDSFNDVPLLGSQQSLDTSPGGDQPSYQRLSSNESEISSVENLRIATPEIQRSLLPPSSDESVSPAESFPKSSAENVDPVERR